MERNEEKIRKQKNSLLWNQHKIFWRLLSFGVIAGLFWACGASIWTIVAFFLGYKVLRLVMRLFGLLLSVLFTVISILILIALISLLLI